MKQHVSSKFEFDCRSEEEIVIISHGLEHAENAPSATIQAGRPEPVNTVKRKLSPSQIEFRRELLKELMKRSRMLKKLDLMLQKQ